MEHDYIRDKILLNYGIESKEIIKVKNTYKIITSDEEYCLKVIKYQYPHFYFIVSAQKHLMKNGFNSIPKILDTIDGKDYIRLDDKLAYLTPWVKCRECDYKNKWDLSLAAKKLSELHNSSEGFVINRDLKPRIAWGKWYKIFETRGEEILDFKKRIYQKAYMSDFDKLYLSIMDEELKRVERTLYHIKTSGYFDYMKKEVKKLGFCHHDYANHNVLLLENNEINIIDFDYCILDSHLHDLSSLCIRTMKEGRWDLNLFKYIIESYSKNKEVRNEEFPIMASFIEFPQAYWQLGLQYYWEQQPWEEEHFLKKLGKYEKDREFRQNFVDELSNFTLR